jgi:hypothetical protein
MERLTNCRHRSKTTCRAESARSQTSRGPCRPWSRRACAWSRRTSFERRAGSSGYVRSTAPGSPACAWRHVLPLGLWPVDVRVQALHVLLPMRGLAPCRRSSTHQRTWLKHATHGRLAVQFSMSVGTVATCSQGCCRRESGFSSCTILVCSTQAATPHCVGVAMLAPGKLVVT